MKDIQEYLAVLEEDLQIEVDKNGKQTELANYLWSLIIATKLQLGE